MESVSIVFRYTSSWYTLCWSIVTVYFSSHQSVGFACVESNKHVKHVKPCYTAPLDVLTFSHQKKFFQQVGRLLTSASLLSSSHFSRVQYISLPGHSFCLSALTEILAQAYYSKTLLAMTNNYV